MRLRRAMVLCVALCARSLRAVASDEPVLAEGLDLTPFLGRLSTCESPWTAHGDACTCPPGWTAHGHSCSPCAAGFFKPEAGIHACTACPGPTTSFAGAVEASECLCAEGHAPAALGSTSACAPCPVSTYKSFVGNNSCVPCPPGHDAQQNACRACPEHSVTGAPGSPCECDAGYAPDNRTSDFTSSSAPCTACAPGKYKSGRGQHVCSECPEHTQSPPATTLPEHCLCAPGFERSTPSGCAPCAANFFCPGRGRKLGCTEHSSSPAGSAASSDCTCLPGFFLYDTECLECGEDFFCSEGVRAQCPANSTSQRRSKTVQDCTCLSGFTAL